MLVFWTPRWDNHGGGNVMIMMMIMMMMNDAAAAGDDVSDVGIIVALVVAVVAF